MIKKIINPKLSRSEKMAFEKHVKANMKRAYYSAFGIIGSHDAAMELSQTAFIKAYRSFKSYDNTKKFFTWYYTILRNLCLNFIRDSKAKNTIDFYDQIELKDDTNSADNIEYEEIKEKLWQSIHQLEFEDKEIIILKEFEGLSYKVIEEVLDIPIGTVMSRLFYARKKLAKKLEVFK
jgi:RNA polymerase sigma-70 factor (ECF subfamily)